MTAAPGGPSSGVDRQWDLMRASFDGDWQGVTTWYNRDQRGGFDLQAGESDPAGSLYSIRFSDPDSGVWHGTGLRFAPGGVRRIPLARHSYNLDNHCWHFPHTAGQSSLEMDGSSARAGHEVNFFTARSRSMLIALYRLQQDGSLVLDAIAATPFRCSRADRDPPRERCSSIEQLLAGVSGWRGVEQQLRPGQWSTESQPQPLQLATQFEAESFQLNDINACFADNLVCSLPSQLNDGCFELSFGCLLTSELFVHLLIEFDHDHRLVSWIERRYQPATIATAAARQAASIDG